MILSAMHLTGTGVSVAVTLTVASETMLPFSPIWYVRSAEFKCGRHKAEELVLGPAAGVPTSVPFRGVHGDNVVAITGGDGSRWLLGGEEPGRVPVTHARNPYNRGWQGRLFERYCIG